MTVQQAIAAAKGLRAADVETLPIYFEVTSPGSGLVSYIVLAEAPCAP